MRRPCRRAPFCASTPLYARLSSPPRSFAMVARVWCNSIQEYVANSLMAMRLRSAAGGVRRSAFTTSLDCRLSFAPPVVQRIYVTIKAVHASALLAGDLAHDSQVFELLQPGDRRVEGDVEVPFHAAGIDDRIFIEQADQLGAAALTLDELVHLGLKGDQLFRYSDRFLGGQLDSKEEEL